MQTPIITLNCLQKKADVTASWCDECLEDSASVCVGFYTGLGHAWKQIISRAISAAAREVDAAKGFSIFLWEREFELIGS